MRTKFFGYFPVPSYYPNGTEPKLPEPNMNQKVNELSNPLTDT